jgi:hypothetical protein
MVAKNWKVTFDDILAFGVRLYHPYEPKIMLVINSDTIPEKWMLSTDAYDKYAKQKMNIISYIEFFLRYFAYFKVRLPTSPKITPQAKDKMKFPITNPIS